MIFALNQPQKQVYYSILIKKYDINNTGTYWVKRDINIWWKEQNDNLDIEYESDYRYMISIVDVISHATFGEISEQHSKSL